MAFKGQSKMYFTHTFEISIRKISYKNFLNGLFEFHSAIIYVKCIKALSKYDVRTQSRPINFFCQVVLMSMLLSTYKRTLIILSCEFWL